MRASGTAAGLAIALALAIAGAASGAETQFWPEADLFVPIDDRTKLFFLVSRTQNVDFEATEGQVGVHVDRKFSSHLRGRLGYRYVHSIGDEDPEVTENRVVLELSPRTGAPAGTTLIWRNRVDLRWINGSDSWRYRPRIRLEREFKTHWPRALAPYASAEAFYDSRSESWARWRSLLGIEATLSDRVVLDPYYAFQNETNSSSSDVDAFGFVFNLTF